MSATTTNIFHHLNRYCPKQNSESMSLRCDSSISLPSSSQQTSPTAYSSQTSWNKKHTLYSVPALWDFNKVSCEFFHSVVIDCGGYHGNILAKSLSAARSYISIHILQTHITRQNSCWKHMNNMNSLYIYNNILSILLSFICKINISK